MQQKVYLNILSTFKPYFKSKIFQKCIIIDIDTKSFDLFQDEVQMDIISINLPPSFVFLIINTFVIQCYSLLKSFSVL